LTPAAWSLSPIGGGANPLSSRPEPVYKAASGVAPFGPGRIEAEEVVNLLRRIVAAVILVPLAIIIVAFAVANRQAVTISFDPLGETPAVSLAMPLFVLILGLLIAGVIIGGVACWLGQGRWRGAARRFERDVQMLRGKLSVYEAMADSQSNMARTAPPPAALRLRPPA
jgi:uncharacterized integral membrane protein